MTSNYVRKQKLKNSQKIKILTSRPDFQSDIQQLRKKWNISNTGLISNEQSQDWYVWLYEKSNKFSNKNWPKEREIEENLTKLGKLIDRQEMNKRFNDSIPLNNFQNDIRNILLKYKLSIDWENPIKRYLLFNDPQNMLPPFGNISMTIGLGEDRFRTLSLQLNAETTLEDVKNIWKYVKLEQKRMLDKKAKFQPSPMIDIDKKAYELKTQNHKITDIAKFISEEFELDDYTYKEATESIRRHKKRIGIL